MKKAVFTLIFVIFASFLAFSDEITFSFIELNAPVVNLTSNLSGMTAGPALNIVVSDTTKHLEFPLSGFFTASTGAATTITSNTSIYEAEYGTGGSVGISGGGITFVAGSPMFDHSHLISNRGEDEGAFAGEFHVTSVDPSVLAMFGLPDKWNPDGSVSVTFGQAHVSGDVLTGVIGGGTVTIETPAPVAENASLIFYGTGLIASFWFAKRRLNA
jgi:hypothetical protein